MTNYNELKNWYLEGKKDGHKFMTVVCDMFDWEDYPVYDDKPYKHVGYRNEEKMEKVMEIYDLSIPFENQNGNEKRGHRIIKRLEVKCGKDGKVYKAVIDCEPKNYNEKVLKELAAFIEYKIKQFLTNSN